MNHLHSRRWNLGFIAMRWRHVFWILPMAGMLVGSAIQWRAHQQRDQARGVMQLHTPWSTPLLTGAIPTLPSLSWDLKSIVLSDEVIGAACLDADLLHEWGTKEECIEKLRPSVSYDSIPGTSLVELTINGKKTHQTIGICTALIEQSAKQANKIEAEAKDEKFKRDSEAIEQLKLNLAAEKTMLESFVKRRASEPWESYPAAWPKILQLQSDLETAITALWSNHMRCNLGSGTGILIHELPGVSPPPSIEDWLAPLVQISRWIGAGVALAFVVACLLELAFPRKQREEIANSVWSKGLQRDADGTVLEASRGPQSHPPAGFQRFR